MPKSKATKPATAPLTKSALVSIIADHAGISRAQASATLDAITTAAADELRAHSKFILPGLVKLTTKATPATKDREGINPFTKQPATIKGKPASFKVKAAAMKALKDAVA